MSKRVRLGLVAVVAVGALVLGACATGDPVADAINKEFGPVAAQATAIAKCESGLNPAAISPGGANWGPLPDQHRPPQLGGIHGVFVEPDARCGGERARGEAHLRPIGLVPVVLSQGPIATFPFSIESDGPALQGVGPLSFPNYVPADGPVSTDCSHRARLGPLRFAIASRWRLWATRSATTAASSAIAKSRYYEARARGGAALILVGSWSVAYPHGTYNRRQLGLSDDTFLAGLRRLTDAVHAHGALIAAQLVHDGPQLARRHRGGASVARSVDTAPARPPIRSRPW